MRTFGNPKPPAGRRGSITVLAAVFLIVAVAFLAFSVDFGYMVVAESDLQNAADAAALSGARALPGGRDAAVAAAQLWAGKNVAAGQPVELVADEDVEIGIWDAGTASFTALPAGLGEAANAVRVTCRRTAERGNPLNLFFAPVMGTRHASVAASAVAAVERDRCGLIVGLDYVNIQNGKVDSYDSDLGFYDEQSPAQNGDVCSDGPITIGPQGLVQGNALPGQGHTVNRPGNVTGSTAPRSGPMSWEAVDASEVVADNDNWRIHGKHLKNGRLRLSGQTELTLEPGTYYFPQGIQVTGQARIVVTGPTRIVMGGKSNVAGNGIVNDTTAPANLRIDMTDGSASFAGNAAFHADIYGPTAELNIRGNGGFYGAAFGRSVTFSGAKAAVHADEALRRDHDAGTVRAALKQ